MEMTIRYVDAATRTTLSLAAGSEESRSGDVPPDFAVAREDDCHLPACGDLSVFLFPFP